MKRLLKYFPEALRMELNGAEKAEELRLRAGRRAMLSGPEEHMLAYTPTQEEIGGNPRSKSAKLRVFERI